MKFLILAGFSESLIKFRGHLIKDLINSGFEVHAAAPDFSHETLSTLTSWGCHCHSISMERNSISPTSDLMTCLDLYSLFRHLRPSFFLAYTIKPVVYGSIIATLVNIPHRFALITGLGYAFSDIGQESFSRKLPKILAQQLYKFSLRNISLVFFQNPDDLHTFQRLKLLNSSAPTKIINGSGVDLSFYSSRESVADHKRPINFLMIARLLKDKGVIEFIEAARILKNKYGNSVSFTLAGWLDSNPNSISHADLEGAIQDGSIVFLGKLADVRPALNTASVYVLPSYREGTPRTVLEAMAMKKPIITTDAPGCRETVEPGKNGFLVPVKSVNLLVEAMENFIQQPSLIDSMGIASFQIAQEKYDVHSVNASMLNAMGIRSSSA